MPEPFACPLCDGQSAAEVRVLRDRMMRTTDEPFTLVRCRSCRLLRLHPLPDDATLSAAYSTEYAPHVRPGLSGRAKSALESRAVRALGDYLRAPRRVLDVGCASGDFLVRVRQAGNPNVTGVETSGAAVDRARTRGLDVFHGELADAEFESGSFDTVVLSHTLEHVGDPRRFMDEVWRILSPGGFVLLWLPNADSVEARLFGRYWIGYDAPRHLTTFSVGTLGRLLATTGFQIESVTHEAVGLEWAWALRLLARDTVPAFERVLGRLHPFTIVACTPAALIGSRKGRSGRIRAIARKHE